MVATSGGGEADELIDEVARNEVNEMGNAMATASSGGEVSEPKEKKKKKSKWTVKQLFEIDDRRPPLSSIARRRRVVGSLVIGH